MKLTILSADASFFAGEASSVTLPGTLGSFSIQNHHAPLMATLEKGTIVVEPGNRLFSIQKGVMEVAENQVTVLVQAKSGT